MTDNQVKKTNIPRVVEHLAALSEEGYGKEKFLDDFLEAIFDAR